MAVLLIITNYFKLKVAKIIKIQKKKKNATLQQFYNIFITNHI